MFGVIAGLALIAFLVLYWLDMFHKFQCVLMVIVGFGLGGLLGTWIRALVSEANNMSNQVMGLVFGVAVPSAFAIAVLLVFVLTMLPDRVAPSKKVDWWYTRIAGLLVPLSLSALPALGSNISAAIGM